MNEVVSSPATAHDLEQHRAALTGHCYRMLGSAAEADDAVQETLVRAWRALDRFEGRSSLRTWLYRIATRVCLDALGHRARRGRPVELGPMGTIDDSLVALPGDQWIEPIPDALVLPADADPYERASLRESIRLAFVAALQHLPPKQRAVLLLTEVLGWPAAEVAGSLETSVAAVNSALQRARATLASRGVTTERAPLSSSQSQLLERFVDAFERYDMDALTSLLHQDATLSMPPYSLWLRGHPILRAWLTGRGGGCRGSRLVPTAASGSLAFGQYRPSPEGGHTAWALIVLETAGEQVVGLNSFLDTAALFPRFGLPPALEP
ncbi:sigma-70 family RNA polymerase sigma factor [Nannocystis bainbridge]|uniref:Sigma-70 family RNA polymerase sigma factor n=1 Tax=Nannocystis bainbridge TaxID=2995303 RepID=A0ABT5E8Y4_9BACT|nr:sigma-70 family RNA polymerase sigma factor [Nannocystis bainbridge]MDC0721307.1 sigma-70 family RNA polymerase sigma factor [Nannocystis bainbridge]